MTQSIRYTATTSLQVSANTLTPTVTDYLRPNAFKFLIAKLPNITYTLQSANLPPIQLGAAVQDTPFVDIPHPGDKITFGEFQCSFLVNEDLSNYRELYDWISALGIPTRGDEWSQITQRASVYQQGREYHAEYSDASLMILDSNNIAKVRINFQDLFPISVEGLQFDITGSGMEYFTCVAAFRYKAFTIDTL